MNHGKRFKFRWLATPALLIFAVFVWTTDRVTFQGERTIYTVDCRAGSWNGNRCSGEVVTGPRFRYRALKQRGEVLFWILGSPEPSSKLMACTIQDGRNWSCPASADAAKSVTLALSRGEPVRNAAWPTRPFHSVSKISWLLLKSGFRFAQVID
jgi:hypothetical protein